MIKRFIRSDRGASMAELALLAPVLIFLVIGVIEIGRYMFFGILAAHAAEAGAKYGSQNLYTAQDNAGIISAAKIDGQSLSQWSVNPSHTCAQNAAIAGTCLTGTPSPGTIYYVTVQVTGRFQSLLNYPGIPTSIPVSATATMRVQNQ